MSSTDSARGGPGGFEIRPARTEDAGALADVLVRSRRAAVPAMPPPVHPDDTAEGHVRSKLRRGRAWVACAEDRGVVGFSLSEDDWLDMLYVVPESAGQGIGSSLLEVVKHEHPGGFALWVFESNAPARRFYRRRGLVELERTDGTDNEEQQPDIRMAWPGHQPMAYLRSQVDEVDARLAAVVNRRVALTREIQRHKPVPGHAGRDDAREAEIAEQMSRIVPSLRVEEWRRIVHAVISVSLDAADREGWTDR